MYLPASFRETRIEVLHSLIRAHPLGLLITAAGEVPLASPLPFLLDTGAGTQGTLRAHLARANPHARALASATTALIVFQGSEGYITPSWYPGKARTHRAVPTWNYAIVEVRGVPRLVDDAAWLRRQIDALTAAHEAQRDPPWSPADAPADYLVAQMQAIVGLEIPIAEIAGKWKMSQNKDDADRRGVIAGLSDPDDPHANAALAAEVSRRLDDRAR